MNIEQKAREVASIVTRSVEDAVRVQPVIAIALRDALQSAVAEEREECANESDDSSSSGAGAVRSGCAKDCATISEAGESAACSSAMRQQVIALAMLESLCWLFARDRLQNLRYAVV